MTVGRAVGRSAGRAVGRPVGLPFGLSDLAALVNLFSGGEAGALYAPWVRSSLYEDSAGTTLASVDGPVGLMLDGKSNYARGAEHVTNGTFDDGIAGWSGASGATPSYDAVNERMNVSISAGDTFGAAEQSISTTAGRFYEATASVWPTSGDAYLRILGGAESSRVSTDGTVRFVFVASGASEVIQASLFGDAASSAFDNISIRELPGNHATQSTADARPVLRSAGGLYWLEFDGVDDELTFDGSFISGNIARSLLFAGRGTNNASGGWWNFGTNTVARDLWALTSEIAVRISGGNEIYASGSVSSDGVVSHVYPGGGTVANSQAWLNGSELAQSSTTDTTPDTSANTASKLFKQISNPSFFSGRMYGGVALPREITTAERQSAERALANRSGVAL